MLSNPQVLFCSVKRCGWTSCLLASTRRRTNKTSFASNDRKSSKHTQKNVSCQTGGEAKKRRQNKKELLFLVLKKNGSIHNVLFRTNSYSRKNLKFIENICERYVKKYFNSFFMKYSVAVVVLWLQQYNENKKFPLRICLLNVQEQTSMW